MYSQNTYLQRNENVNFDSDTMFVLPWNWENPGSSEVNLF